MEDTGLCLLLHLCELFWQPSFSASFLEKKNISEIHNKRWIITQNCRTGVCEDLACISPYFFFHVPFGPVKELIWKSVHLVKSSGNPEMPGSGNLGRFCLNARSGKEQGMPGCIWNCSEATQEGTWLLPNQAGSHPHQRSGAWTPWLSTCCWLV